MSRDWETARVKAMTRPDFDPTWASSTVHARDLWPAPDRRRKCHCGCGGRATHVGGCNGIALTSGCEMSVRRWVKGAGGPQPGPGAPNRASADQDANRGINGRQIEYSQEDA